MAALNKCNPTQLLILHIIKFLIYTLCFHGPTHNSLVLNSWVVKTNTLDKCWSLYLLFFGWQFSFSLPHFKLNIRKGFWSCALSSSFKEKSLWLLLCTHRFYWQRAEHERGNTWIFSSYSRYWSSLEDIIFCGRISKVPWSQKEKTTTKRVGSGADLATFLQNVMYQIMLLSSVFPFSWPGVA